VFRENEEKGDSMRALENRTLESKREMDILDALEEIKERNARSGQMDTSAILGESLSRVWILVLCIFLPYVWHYRSLVCVCKILVTAFSRQMPGTPRMPRR
jgi:hypothetical protein